MCLAMQDVIGSSPLTRGKHLLGFPAVPSLRLIPAHAGKTHPAARLHRMIEAHPRSRGENERVVKNFAALSGSSPLTRGKRMRPGLSHRAAGLIPAHAGKTRKRAWKNRQRPAHPRSRGENSGGCDPPQLPRGSSPLTRGKPSHCRFERCGGRLIPAHAGKTLRAASSTPSRTAHPRSRGENLVAAIFAPF